MTIVLNSNHVDRVGNVTGRREPSSCQANREADDTRSRVTFNSEDLAVYKGGETISTNEIFLIAGRNAGEYVIFSPIKGVLVSCNHAAVHRIKRGIEENVWPENLSPLKGILDVPNNFNPNDRFDLVTDFNPIGVMLELTTDCNLRCRYCYANAGDTPKSLQWSVAKAAIDLIAQNARKLKREFSIFFHGRGEPTSNWNLLTRCVEYANNIAAENTRPLIRMATNGVLSNEQLDFIIKNFESVSLSLDGPEWVHDRNRADANGNGSYKHAYRSGRYFLKNGFNFGIKAVTTSDDVDALPERIQFFKEHFPGISVGFEPLNEFGRCKESGASKPNFDRFIQVISEAMDASPDGTYSYSGVLRPEVIRMKFCGAMRPTFGVHSDGRVVACVGVPLGNDYSDAFCYGEFDFDRLVFIFNDQKVQELRSLLIDQFSRCDGCFAKWNCAGDCPSYRLFQEKLGHTDSGIPIKCHLNRELLRKRLLEKLEKEGQMAKSITE